MDDKRKGRLRLKFSKSFPLVKEAQARPYEQQGGVRLQLAPGISSKNRAKANQMLSAGVVETARRKALGRANAQAIEAQVDRNNLRRTVELGAQRWANWAKTPPPLFPALRGDRPAPAPKKSVPPAPAPPMSRERVSTANPARGTARSYSQIAAGYSQRGRTPAPAAPSPGQAFKVQGGQGYAQLARNINKQFGFKGDKRVSGRDLFKRMGGQILSAKRSYNFKAGDFNRADGPLPSLAGAGGLKAKGIARSAALRQKLVAKGAFGKKPTPKPVTSPPVRPPGAMTSPSVSPSALADTYGPRAPLKMRTP